MEPVRLLHSRAVLFSCGNLAGDIQAGDKPCQLSLSESTSQSAGQKLHKHQAVIDIHAS